MNLWSSRADVVANRPADGGPPDLRGSDRRSADARNNSTPAGERELANRSASGRRSRRGRCGFAGAASGRSSRNWSRSTSWVSPTSRSRKPQAACDPAVGAARGLEPVGVRNLDSCSDPSVLSTDVAPPLPCSSALSSPSSSAPASMAMTTAPRTGAARSAADPAVARTDIPVRAGPRDRPARCREQNPVGEPGAADGPMFAAARVADGGGRGSRRGRPHRGSRGPGSSRAQDTSLNRIRRACPCSGCRTMRSPFSRSIPDPRTDDPAIREDARQGRSGTLPDWAAPLPEGPPTAFWLRIGSRACWIDEIPDPGVSPCLTARSSIGRQTSARVAHP
jgi:hypothetical protein